MNNQYLQEFNACQGNRWNVQDLDVCSDKRRNLVVRYAWAVPDEHAIEIILKYSPIVEIGCGTGYWASLIASKGGIVFPYDAHVPGIDRNPYEHEITYCNVLRGSIEVLDKLKFTLFLCWPPHNNSFAYDALMRYRGDTLIYVGEDEYGCTADRTFFKELSRHWKFIEGHKLPQWDGIYDYLEVHKRI